MDKKKKRLLVRTIILLILAAAVGYTLYANLTRDEKGSVQKGDQAPDFVLKDLHGKEHKLSDYKGKGVFLNFWGTWCEPCKKEMPDLEKVGKEYKSKGVEILAVNVGEPDLVVKKFAEQYHLTFPIMIDGNKEVLRAYGVDPLPTTFLIDSKGRVKEVIIGGLQNEEQVREKLAEIKP
ncbi:thiol-disulfide oxidoreductase ResA [Bacillus smithii]|uniref:thiol-disulfide oxidoreductase ResA n=1 Tax=Bacillus smithii TaxID=1479 RepID=UPI003D20C3A3